LVSKYLTSEAKGKQIENVLIELIEKALEFWDGLNAMFDESNFT
jgi:hypothetical protein